MLRFAPFALLLVSACSKAPTTTTGSAAPPPAAPAPPPPVEPDATPSASSAVSPAPPGPVVTGADANEARRQDCEQTCAPKKPGTARDTCVVECLLKAGPTRTAPPVELTR